MRRVKEKNMAMITISAVILVATNMGVWLAAHEGAIAPIDNRLMWSAFMALNVAAILWAVILLGLQPMVVALSYVAGAFMAYKGVEGLEGISVAEVTTAGATYGAFGSLVVGNVTTKVRLAFYNKKQVPFIFIVAALLVLDAVLNSGISSAGGLVILYAVVFPFMLAGVVVGLIWTVLNHFGIGYNPREMTARAEVETDVNAEAAVTEESDRVLTFQAPEEVEEDEGSDSAESETFVESEVPDTPSVKETAEPVAAFESEEEFFPLEIDNDEDFIVPVDDPGFRAEAEEDIEPEEDPFSLSNFDSGLYASGADDQPHIGVMIEEPIASLSVDVEEEVKPFEEETPAQEATPPEPAAEEAMIPEPVAEEATIPEPVAEEATIPEPVAEEDTARPDKKDSSGDWLNGHLDLLNKLK